MKNVNIMFYVSIVLVIGLALIVGCTDDLAGKATNGNTPAEGGACGSSETGCPDGSCVEEGECCPGEKKCPDYGCVSQDTCCPPQPEPDGCTEYVCIEGAWVADFCGGDPELSCYCPEGGCTGESCPAETSSLVSASEYNTLSEVKSSSTSSPAPLATTCYCTRKKCESKCKSCEECKEQNGAFRCVNTDPSTYQPCGSGDLCCELPESCDAAAKPEAECVGGCTLATCPSPCYSCESSDECKSVCGDKECCADGSDAVCKSDSQCRDDCQTGGFNDDCRCQTCGDIGQGCINDGSCCPESQLGAGGDVCCDEGEEWSGPDDDGKCCPAGETCYEHVLIPTWPNYCAEKPWPLDKKC